MHQFGFGGKARAALQAFSGDAGKQIRVDLVVFAHGDGSVPLRSGRNLSGMGGVCPFDLQSARSYTE